MYGVRLVGLCVERLWFVGFFLLIEWLNWLGLGFVESVDGWNMGRWDDGISGKCNVFEKFC